MNLCCHKLFCKTFLKNRVLPVTVIAAAASFLGFLFWISGDPVLGRVHPAERAPKRHTILLIDQTDVLSSRCLRKISERIKLLPETIQPGEMLSIFSIHADSDIAITPLFSGYNPGTGGNEWVENLKMKEQEFRETFLEPLMAIANGMRPRPTSPSSPIIETINRLVCWKKFSALIPERRLIIYSDMLQNSINCSDYPDSKTVYPESPGCMELINLKNVAVEIRYILRRSHYFLQTLQHQQEWINRFEDAGASVSLDRTS